MTRRRSSAPEPAPAGELDSPPPPGKNYYYLFINNPDLKKVDDVKGVPELTGSDLKLSGTRQDFDPTTNRPVVLMQFTGSGSHKFQQVTSEEYNRGRNRNGLRSTSRSSSTARSGPSRRSTRRSPTSRAGSAATPRFRASARSARPRTFALVLQTGALPVNFVQIERTDISATLGKDSLSEAKKAALIGLLLVVAVFLLVLYRFLGLVAVIGLGIYAAFLYAAILLFNVTLTLPGFAGLILTIGVAADANVVVFERIKEEVRAGKSVRAAIAAGYAKGFHTIIDANVVTLITALVLFAVATAGVKGFALMLIIGTVISLVTAVAATRAMLGLLSGFTWFDNPRFMGAAGQQSAKWLQIDFMRRRYLWFAISGVIIVIGAASLGAKGLNLGIDFKGGTQVTFKTPKPVSLTDVRNQAKDDRPADASHSGPWQDVRQRELRELPDADEVADARQSRTSSTKTSARNSGRQPADHERVLELRETDRALGDRRGHRLAVTDRALHRGQVRPQVRWAGDRGAAARHRDHRRRLLADRARGLQLDGGRRLNGARATRSTTRSSSSTVFARTSR